MYYSKLLRFKVGKFQRDIKEKISETSELVYTQSKTIKTRDTG